MYAMNEKRCINVSITSHFNPYFRFDNDLKAAEKERYKQCQHPLYIYIAKLIGSNSHYKRAYTGRHSYCFIFA